jgi:hypothetical protein
MNTKIDAAKVQSLVLKHGLAVTKQSAFVRVESPNGLRVYFSASPWVTRCDLSGFETQHPGVVAYAEDKKPTGQVTQKVNFEQGEEAILETIDAVLEEMKNIFAVGDGAEEESKKMSKKAQAGEQPVAQGWSFEATTESTEAQA